MANLYSHALSVQGFPSAMAVYIEDRPGHIGTVGG